jgi:polyisoprenoid-binding protein YceI
MVKKLALFAFAALTVMFSVAPVFAQDSVSQIDSEHSTARLYLASSKNPNGSVNVGVGRASGVVTLSGGSSGTPDFDFTIYPADKKLSPAGSEAVRADNRSRYTVVSFKSHRTVSLGRDAYRVSGDLTVTDVQRIASYDPSEAFAGASYGPSIASSQNQQVTLDFHRVTPSHGSTNAEWTALATISGEDFPELLSDVSSTNWPVFVADQRCASPAHVGEDFSGPACTGERVETAVRNYRHCEMPASVGEDFAGEVCTIVAAPLDTTDTRQNLSASRHHKNADSSRLVANEVRIQLDLFTTNSSSTASLTSGQ